MDRMGSGTYRVVHDDLFLEEGSGHFCEFLDEVCPLFVTHAGLNNDNNLAAVVLKKHIELSNQVSWLMLLIDLLVNLVTFLSYHVDQLSLVLWCQLCIRILAL